MLDPKRVKREEFNLVRPMDKGFKRAVYADRTECQLISEAGNYQPGVCWNESISIKNRSRMRKKLLFIDGSPVRMTLASAKSSGVTVTIVL